LPLRFSAWAKSTLGTRDQVRPSNGRRCKLASTKEAFRREMGFGRSLSWLAAERWYTWRKGSVKTGREGGLRRRLGRRTHAPAGRGRQAQQMDNVAGTAYIEEIGNLGRAIIA